MVAQPALNIANHFKPETKQRDHRFFILGIPNRRLPAQEISDIDYAK